MSMHTYLLGKAVLAAFFGVASAAATANAAATAPSTFKPGVYEATVNGHNAPMTVKVTVSKNRIEKITIPKIWKRSASARSRSTS